ncbi:hypothetical protein R1T16_08495 [Flavobacterium sp. DG1-102-2]|uniref:hypothetical protein n=1 Tax=Flavobacterium sp. DG1-102-2 TaxID=3081663 RepID=UPI00294A2895|nr:hypothetical protein [Flavobacterium sp. DG1-102-2]MDV6168465.1 hypothetical protein [Flavobacterium sp. DG1-102-2]
MKLKTTYLIVLFTILFSAAASAQVDRRVGQGQYKSGPQKKEKTDYAEQTSNYLATELKLDAFQKAAVKNILNDEKENITSLGDNREMTTMEKKDKLREITERIQKKITPLLSKEQAEKYTKLEEARKF